MEDSPLRVTAAGQRTLSAVLANLAGKEEKLARGGLSPEAEAKLRYEIACLRRQIGIHQ